MPMKCIILFNFLLSTVWAISQCPKETDFGYWNWGESKEKITQTLDEKNIPYTIKNQGIYRSHIATIFQQMETLLGYNQEGLWEIQQHKYFDQGELEKARLFFNKRKENMVECYGNSKSEMNDFQDQKEEVIWNHKNTLVKLVFWYGEDESYGSEDMYTISVFIQPLKNTEN